jgi:hypothetical protein
VDRSLIVLLRVAFALGFLSVAISCSAQSLEGIWQVEDSACQGCDPARGPEVGAVMRIGSDRLQNPFATDCDRGLVLRSDTRFDSKSLLAKYDLPVRWLPKDHATRSLVAERYTVLCAERPIGVLISIDDGQSVLVPIEPSTLIRFLRTDRP